MQPAVFARKASGCGLCFRLVYAYILSSSIYFWYPEKSPPDKITLLELANPGHNPFMNVFPDPDKIPIVFFQTRENPLHV